MNIPSASELKVTALGSCPFLSPLAKTERALVGDHQGVLAFSESEVVTELQHNKKELPIFELAGPRGQLFFEPAKLTVGIVTCGGVCPGLNDVIRSIALTALRSYGVKRVLGFRYGYNGLAKACYAEPIELSDAIVNDIHLHPGTMLGSSRGPQDVSEMIDTLQRYNVGILFAIGGDGTLRGASSIAKELRARKIPIAVIGIPKTIDNDVSWTTLSFGFSTAVEEAKRAVMAAHAEAVSAYNGIGLVRLMGRHSGFIAAHTVLATGVVNFCLVPEVPFCLEGDRGLLAALEQRIVDRHHAVVVVAEGAGRSLQQAAAEKSQGNQARDASGNLKLIDIGLLLKDQINTYFADRKVEITLKYIDPSYMIRSAPANPIDSELCLMLGQNAVHAGLSGRTDMVVCVWNRHFIHVPIDMVVGVRKQIDPQGEIWQSVLTATQQPRVLR